MPERNEGRVIDQPIIEIKANKDIIDTHICLRLRKEKRPVMCKKCLQFGHLKEVLL